MSVSRACHEEAESNEAPRSPNCNTPRHTLHQTLGLPSYILEILGELRCDDVLQLGLMNALRREQSSVRLRKI
jgi:hypothetical protein